MVNVGKYTITGFCGYISVKLTAFSHCKWMVGRRSFLFGSRPTFQGDLLVFGSVIREFRHKKPGGTKNVTNPVMLHKFFLFLFGRY